MDTIDNKILHELAKGSYKNDSSYKKLLLPVQRLLKIPNISFRNYAAALVKKNLVKEAINELKSLKSLKSLSFELIGRVMLFEQYLQNLDNISDVNIGIGARKYILKKLYASLPYYQPEPMVPSKEVRPSKVKIKSPLRIDLGMGGLSDLPPWTNERPGCTVSLCANIDLMAPIQCLVEIVKESGLYIEAVGRGPQEHITTWKSLQKSSLSTRIARNCLFHLIRSKKNTEELSDFLERILGGGLRIETTSRVPKGLGSSAIIASIILQGIIRLLGYTINEQDIVHRTITIERMMGVGGGWEDSLAAFHGGVVIAESKPSAHPEITAKQIDLPESTFAYMQERFILFDTGWEGDSGKVLTEGSLRYLSGNPETIDASLRLIDIAKEVSYIIQKCDFDQLGSLLTKQWEAWKIITNNFCTNEKIDSLITEAQPWIEGAKVNGAGSGGAILFVTKQGQRENLIKFLDTQTGSVIDWSPSIKGYQLDEWYDSSRVAASLQKSIPKSFKKNKNFNKYGIIKKCNLISSVKGLKNQELIGPINPAIFNILPNLLLSVSVTNAALVDYIGSGGNNNLVSIKRLIDSIASNVFDEEMKTWNHYVPVCISEGKNERGKLQPTVKATIYNQSYKSDMFNCALDVVDGTTLAALGLPGSYSISAIAKGLLSFPDLQAYAILAPKIAFSSLDMTSIPDQAVENNIKIIAEALDKRVQDLTIVTHSDDTGHHHQALIKQMQSMGVNVIIPNPVIVELPYTLTACLGSHSHIDAIIGIFGLPEIILNTILSGTLNCSKCFIFRIVGNSIMGINDKFNLESVFTLTPEEIEVLKKYRLNPNTLYTFDDIVTRKGCAIAASVITDDKLLGLRGVQKTGNHISLYSWIVDPCGNIFNFFIDFERDTLIDYTARYHIPLRDISLLIQIENTIGGKVFISRVEELMKKIQLVTKGAFFQTTYQTQEGEPGLHVTLFEFVVDFIPSNKKNENEFTLAVEASLAATRKIPNNQKLFIGKARRHSKGIIITVSLENNFIDNISRIGNYILDKRIFNILSGVRESYITIARFSQIQSKDNIAAIDGLLNEFNDINNITLTVNQLTVMKATKTPFRNVTQHEIIDLVK